ARSRARSAAPRGTEAARRADGPPRTTPPRRASRRAAPRGPADRPGRPHVSASCPHPILPGRFGVSRGPSAGRRPGPGLANERRKPDARRTASRRRDAAGRRDVRRVAFVGHRAPRRNPRSMRTYLVLLLAGLAVPLALISPLAGLVAYCWLAYMRP